MSKIPGVQNKGPEEKELQDIYCLMRCLGVTANYMGYYHTAYAVYLSLQQPDRLLLVTKWLYPDVAKHFGVDWKCVERNIRLTRDIAWNRVPLFLEELAQYPLPTRPTPAQFLSILTAYCSGKRAA